MSDTIACRTCGNAFARGDRFCPKCGTTAKSGRDTSGDFETRIDATNPTLCLKCSATMGRDDRFCPQCGNERVEAATVISNVSLRNAQAAQLAEATRGEFEVVEQLGVGAMGSVYLARDTALSRNVAIKVIASNLLQDESMVARFRQEAQTVASLRHPNIVNVHAVREADNLHYFVMDFIDGPPLRTIIKAHAPLEVPVVQSLLYQVGSALDYAHHRGRGVVHRDIKPANIMVDRGGDAFVTDFGISKITESQTGLTQTGATIGTPEYMSPEQCRGEDLTGASDQYALGIVAYEMLCGRTPFRGTQYHIMVAHTSEQPSPILSARPDCPPHVAEAIHRMLGKSPRDRFPDLESAVTAMGGAPLSRKDPIRSRITVLTGPQTAVGGQATVVMSTAVETTGTATSVTLLGVPARVEVGDTFHLSADVQGGSQGSNPGAPVEWSSTDPAVAVVERGQVRAVAVGTVAIMASVAGLSNSVTLHVIDAAPAAVVVEPSTLVVSAGDRTPVRARVEDRNGHVLARPVRWLTSDPRVASVDRTGEVVATGTGSAIVTAECAGVTGTVSVAVSAKAARRAVPVAGASSVAKTPKSATGRPSPRPGPAPRHPRGRNRAIAGVLALGIGLSAVGAYQAGLLGAGASARTTTDSVPRPGASVASLPTDSASASSAPVIGAGRPTDTLPTPPPQEEPEARPQQPVTRTTPPPARRPAAVVGSDAPAVEAPRATRIRMGVQNRTMVLGDVQPVLVEVLDQNGRPLDAAGGQVTLHSLNDAVGAIDPTTRRLRAVGAGFVDVEARLGSIRESVRVAVDAPVRGVEIVGGDRDVDVGYAGRLSANVSGPGGMALGTEPVSWTSSNPSVVIVAAGGGMRARAPGVAEVTATAGSISSRIRVTVSAAETAVPTPAQATQAIGNYLALLSTGDKDAVTVLHGSEGPEQLADLLRMMDSNGFAARLETAEPPASGRLGPQSLFAATLRTRSSFGGQRATTRRFLATFTPAGRQWRLASVVMLPE